MSINLNLRSKILEYSLNIEKKINDILLLYLKIHTNDKDTRLFGNRPGISFKNKIDLLFDLKILSKEENSNFELLMNFRNKFLHDIDCNTFDIVFEQLDNGIVNRFKKFSNEGSKIDNEAEFLVAFDNLYNKNINVLSKKIKDKASQININNSLVQNFRKQIDFQSEIFHTLIAEISSKLNNTEIKSSKFKNIKSEIDSLLLKSSNDYFEGEEISIIKKEQGYLIENSDSYKEYWGIVASNKYRK